MNKIAIILVISSIISIGSGCTDSASLTVQTVTSTIQTKISAVQSWATEIQNNFAKLKAINDILRSDSSSTTSSPEPAITPFVQSNESLPPPVVEDNTVSQ